MSSTLAFEHPDAVKIAEKIFADAFVTSDDPVTRNLANSENKLPLDGITQTVILLDLAVKLDEPEFFAWTGQWTVAMMSHRLPFLSEDHLKNYIAGYCRIMQEQLWWLDTEAEQNKARDMLDGAINTINSTACSDVYHDYLIEDPYSSEKSQYLDFLLQRNIQAAYRCINDALDKYPLKDVFTGIIQGAMYAVGELWLRGTITVAQEHYCTAATQTIIAQIYPRLINIRRDKGTIVIACIGSELHELGARMISDILESEGWDSIFLGAAVPLRDLIDTLKAEQPKVCALSVALQQGVLECAEMVSALKKEFPDLTVAVGGHAFNALKNGRAFVGADIFATTVDELLSQLDEL